MIFLCSNLKSNTSFVRFLNKKWRTHRLLLECSWSMAMDYYIQGTTNSRLICEAIFEVFNLQVLWDRLSCRHCHWVANSWSCQEPTSHWRSWTWRGERGCSKKTERKFQRSWSSWAPGSSCHTERQNPWFCCEVKSGEQESYFCICRLWPYSYDSSIIGHRCFKVGKSFCNQCHDTYHCRHRVPEPIRQADLLSREYLRVHHPSSKCV